MKLGFIGTGVMGSAMASHLIAAGHNLTVYNRTKSKAQKLLDLGARWADTPKLVAQNSEVIFSMVGFPKDVEEIYFNKNGIFAGASAGSILIDMTTSQPSLAVKITEEASRHQLTALDAPVSGGDVGAQNGTLTIMVGGDKNAYDRVLPLFDTMGQATNYFGGAGAGQHAKMANQIMIAGTMTGLTEMLLYAKAAGLNPKTVLDTLSKGGADNWSMDTYVPRILNDDFTPGFFARHFLKDLRIALDEADQMGLDLQATANAKRLYEVMVDVYGLGNLGTQGLIKIYKTSK